MTEAQLLAEITRAAKALGIMAFHVPDSRGMAPGFPDLVLAGWHGTLFRELKADYEQPTSAQREAGYRLQASGLDWALWRPADLASGTVQRELEEIA